MNLEQALVAEGELAPIDTENLKPGSRPCEGRELVLLRGELQRWLYFGRSQLFPGA